MALDRPMPPLVLSDEEVKQLQGFASSMGLMYMTVGKWPKRYRVLGLEGIHDEICHGRPRTYEGDHE